MATTTDSRVAQLEAQRDVLAKIAKQGKRREQAQIEAKLALDEIAKLASEGLRVGLSKVDIAAAGNMSRTTLDKALGE